MCVFSSPQLEWCVLNTSSYDLLLLCVLIVPFTSLLGCEDREKLDAFPGFVLQIEMQVENAFSTSHQLGDPEDNETRLAHTRVVFSLF